VESFCGFWAFHCPLLSYSRCFGGERRDLLNTLADLSGNGMDNDPIRIMLVGLENMLVVHLQEREKLRGEIAKLDSSTQGPQPSDR
jgi:hypothetical protein